MLLWQFHGTSFGTAQQDKSHWKGLLPCLVSPSEICSPSEAKILWFLHFFFHILSLHSCSLVFASTITSFPSQYTSSLAPKAMHYSVGVKVFSWHQSDLGLSAPSDMQTHWLIGAIHVNLLHRSICFIGSLFWGEKCVLYTILKERWDRKPTLIKS